jgi:NADH:ubiquinone oxidoreductase subunit 5 (subunit L)/multisubunit Na+/H+ antiporter MnhA subunit
MNCAFVFILVAPLLPLLAALGIAAHILSGRARGDAAEPPTGRIATGAAWAVVVLMLALDALALVEGAPGHFTLGAWFSSGAVDIPISFMADGLALGAATLVALIGAVTLHFSRNYLHRELGFHRFFMLMSLFLAGMLLIVLSGNAALTFVGWELCGLTSFLLIGYAYERPVATGNALYAFLSNRIGDAGFVLGISLAAWWVGSLEWAAIADWAAGAGENRFDKVQARLLLFGFLLAAVIKSAQVPFAAWIARALEGPTPSSAIFYGAVMVHAGVYLTIRLEPVLLQVPDIMVYLALIGAATALYGWLGGLVQTDVKSALIFSTTLHVGLMFLLCGLGAFEAAAWYMAAHASWRAWQFLLAPSYMHTAAGPAGPAPRWLAGRQWLYTAALQRFWLEGLVRNVLIRPFQAIGRDMRDLDDKLLSHLVGMPERWRAGPRAEGDSAVIVGHGLAGRALYAIAETFRTLENRLLMKGSGGAFAHLMLGLGKYLLLLESMIEQPRYLILVIATTFIVIL